MANPERNFTIHLSCDYNFISRCNIFGGFGLYFFFSFEKIYYQITCQNKNCQKKKDGM